MPRFPLTAAVAAALLASAPAAAQAPVAGLDTSAARTPVVVASGAAAFRLPPVARDGARAAPATAFAMVRDSGRVVGVRGAMLGAVAGAALGALAAYALCDAENCATHPDSRTLVLGGIAAGAVGGAVLDHVVHRMRRERRAAR